MDAVSLHFPDPGTKPLRLRPGTHAIADGNGRLDVLTPPAEAALTLQVDGRGIWMHICAQSHTCVHVNGRRVYQIALLRPGDVVHVDTLELRLRAEPQLQLQLQLPESESESDAAPRDPCWVLRGLGGQYHGRCLTLDRPRWIGRSAKADIHLDDPACGERHLHLERVNDQVLLRDLGSAKGSLVNGQPVRDALLQAGDQLVVGSDQRFLLEAPHQHATVRAQPDSRTPPPQHLPPAPRAHVSWSLWLLFAAAMLAGVMSILLLFGKAG